MDARRYKKDKERLSFELLEIQQQREREADLRLLEKQQQREREAT